MSWSFCKKQKTQIIEILYKLGVVSVGKYSMLIIGLTREGNKSFLITSLVDYMFPHSNLPNCTLSSDSFVNEIAFLLLPLCRMCHIAERHTCPSKSLFSAFWIMINILLKKTEYFLQPSGILLLYGWLQFFQGKKRAK